MSDQSYKPATTPAPPAVQAPEARAQRPARGNAAAAEEAPAQAAPTEGPGFFDRLGALSGSTHMRTLLGPNGSGVEWNDKEKGANKPNVDKWGDDRIRLAKLRIASINRGGFQARNVQADGIDLNERSRAKDGRFVADLEVPTASAESIVSTSPALQAAGVQLGGVKVHREYEGKELTEFFTKPGDTRVEVQSATVTGLKTADFQADSLAAGGMGATTDGTTHTLTGERMHAEGISAGGVSLARADAEGASATIKPGDVSFAARDLGASGVTAGATQFATIGTHGLSLRSGAGGVSVQAQSATATGFAAPGVTVADAQADRLAVSASGGATTVGADRLTLGATDAKGFHADQTVLAGASATTEGRGTTVSARQLNSTGLVAGGATIGGVSAADARLSVGEGVSARFGSAEARDIAGGGMTLAGASARGVGLDVGANGTTVSAEQLAASRLAGHGVSVASADAKGARIGSAGGLHLGVDELHARDVAGAGASAQAVDATALAARVGPNGVNGTLGALDATGLRAGDVSASRASLTGATLDTNGTATSLGARSLQADGLSAGALNAGHLSAEGAKIDVANGVTRGSADSLNASRLAVAGVKADKADASGVSFRNGGGESSVRARNASATNVSAGSARAASVKGSGLNVSAGAAGTNASADSLNATRIRAAGVSLESAEAKRAAVNQSGSGTAAKTTATAGSVSGAGLVAGDLTARRIGAEGVNATVAQSRGQPTINAGATSASGSGVAYAGDAGRTSAESVQLTGLTHQQTGDHSTTAARSTSATGLQHRSTAAPSSGSSSRGGAPSSGPSLAQQAAGLVDSAHLRGSVPLNPMTSGEGTGRITVKPGTTAYVEVQVQGGQIVPAATKATFSQPLDTWGWTSVPGVYMSREGKLYAEVNGLWDKELTAQMNKALGRTGSAVPLRVSDLAASMGGAGGSGGSGSAGGSGPSMARTDELQASGTVGLRAGTIRSDGMSATLGSAPGANTAKVEIDGTRSLSVEFSKLLLEAFGIRAGGARVDVKSVSAGSAALHQAGARTDVSAGTLRTGAASITR